MPDNGRKPPIAAYRTLAIQRVREHLTRQHYPRTQMAFIVALTGGFGLLASFAMLHLGVDTMAIRYPVALSFAYLFFLFLIWLWLRTTARDYWDAPGLPHASPDTQSSSAHTEFTSGGSGDFRGGGASGAFDDSTSAINQASSSPSASTDGTIGSLADAEELAIPLVVLALSTGIAVASLYVVSIAPILFAEVLVDGALSYALFHRLRRDQRHWLTSALRRTVIPFTATAVFLAAAGTAMQTCAPEARSIGQVMAHLHRP